MLGSYICKLMWSGRAYICDDLIMTGRKYKLQKKRCINNNKGEENNLLLTGYKKLLLRIDWFVIYIIFLSFLQNGWVK